MKKNLAPNSSPELHDARAKKFIEGLCDRIEWSAEHVYYQEVSNDDLGEFATRHHPRGTIVRTLVFHLTGSTPESRIKVYQKTIPSQTAYELELPEIVQMVTLESNDRDPIMIHRHWCTAELATTDDLDTLIDRALVELEDDLNQYRPFESIQQVHDFIAANHIDPRNLTPAMLLLGQTRYQLEDEEDR